MVTVDLHDLLIDISAFAGRSSVELSLPDVSYEMQSSWFMPVPCFPDARLARQMCMMHKRRIQRFLMPLCLETDCNQVALCEEQDCKLSYMPGST